MKNILLILTIITFIMIELVFSKKIKYKDCTSSNWIEFLNINCKNNISLKNKKEISKFCKHLKDCYLEYKSNSNDISIHLHEGCNNVNNLNIFNQHMKNACDIVKVQ
jgi:hypothetical protein